MEKEGWEEEWEFWARRGGGGEAVEAKETTRVSRRVV